MIDELDLRQEKKWFYETKAKEVIKNLIKLNMNGVGNRVAPMIFGPHKVIIVGANKIVKDLEEAHQRIHHVATPINNMRHYLKGHFDTTDLACVKTGKCVDCKSPARSCRFTAIIEGSLPDKKDRIHVIIVGEELGI